MNLRSINLNLLPILASLLHEKNVSRAAAAVGMSQPAASRALAQLRAVLKDPLLVPSGQGLARTARGDALIDTVDALCRELAAFWQPDAFDPAVLKREFVFASSDYAPIIAVSQLSPRLLAEAPGVSMRFTELAPAQTISVPRGVDFVIVPRMALDGHIAGGGNYATLFAEAFVPVVAATHPLAGLAPRPDEVDGFPHIVFSAGDNVGLPRDDIELLCGRRPPKILAIVQNFNALPHLVLSTGAVAVMPRRLAEMMIRDGMPIVVLVEPAPRVRIEMCLGWTARFNSDIVHKWFRDLVISALADGKD